MKYAVIEAENYLMSHNHPSGICVTDGDCNELVNLNCVGRAYETGGEAVSALKKYLEDVKTIINNSGELRRGWVCDYGIDDWSLIVEKFNDEGDVIDRSQEWVIKCSVIEIPESDREVEEYSSFLDFAKIWW